MKGRAQKLVLPTRCCSFTNPILFHRSLPYTQRKLPFRGLGTLPIDRANLSYCSYRSRAKITCAALEGKLFARGICRYWIRETRIQFRGRQFPAGFQAREKTLRRVTRTDVTLLIAKCAERAGSSFFLATI